MPRTNVLFAVKGRYYNAVPYLITAAIYLASSLPGMSQLYLLFSLVGLVYWTIKKDDQLVLLLLLLGSSFSYTSLNIWNNGIVPVLPFLLLVFSLLVARVRVTNANLTIATLCVVILFVPSICNVFVVGVSPVMVDLLVVLSIPLAALRFRKLSEHKFFLSLSACALISLLRIVLFAFFDVENPVLSTYTDAKFLDALDELTGFYILFVIVLISAPNQMRWVGISLLSALALHYIALNSWLGYYGIGSQILLMIFFFIILALTRFPLALLVIAGMVAFFIPMIVIYLEGQSDLKLLQLKSVFDILGGYNIALLPHSVQVRVAEITTFFNAPWTHQFFGGGLGGYINLSNDFPSVLGPDDFSDQQINSGNITTPHNLGYLMIKFGYIGLAIILGCLVLIYRTARRMTALKFSLYMTLGVFLILNLGYTLKISFLLGVLWAVIGNYSRFTRVETSQPCIDEIIKKM